MAYFNRLDPSFGHCLLSKFIKNIAFIYRDLVLLKDLEPWNFCISHLKTEANLVSEMYFQLN
jgi:hypothetical protein